MEKVRTLHAIPVAIGDVIEADTTGVVRGIAAVTQEQDVLTLRRIAYGARVPCLLLCLVGIIAQPLMDVELGNLFLVLDIVSRDGGA